MRLSAILTNILKKLIIIMHSYNNLPTKFNEIFFDLSLYIYVIFILMLLDKFKFNYKCVFFFLNTKQKKNKYKKITHTNRIMDHPHILFRQDRWCSWVGAITNWLYPQMYRRSIIIIIKNINWALDFIWMGRDNYFNFLKKKFIVLNFFFLIVERNLWLMPD